MAIYSASIVSTSGLEIMSAFTVAAIVVTAIRRPESLWNTATLVTLTIAGSTLILSRQLGIVTMIVLSLIGLVLIGWRTLWQLTKERTVLVASCGATLAVAAGLLAFWERTYDRPAETGPPFTAHAWGRFLESGFEIIRSGIGVFGWLDTPLPRWSVAAWIIIAVLLCGMAMLLGSRRDRWCLGAMLVLTFVITYVTYATVFDSITASLQGRHVLPLFMFVPLFAGVVVAENIARAVPEATARLYTTVALTMAAIQFVAVYWNGRRYAVGTNGAVFYLSDAAWSPRFGWTLWLVIAVAGSALLAAFGVRSRPVGGELVPKGAHLVER
jgi:uncharacterized membrane protein